MLFLFGMFVVGGAAGCFLHLASRLFSRAESVRHLVFLILVGAGALSALLMNDTLAVVGTPLMLYFARRHGISPKLLLLALAFAVTTGSVASPIGNPQNLLIALSGGVENPFITFPLYLIVPTVISLLVAYVFLCRAFRDELHPAALVHCEEEIRDPSLAALARLSLILLVLLIVAVIWSFVPEFDIRLTWIALVAALPILAGAGGASRSPPGRLACLAFFAAPRPLASVWQSGSSRCSSRGNSIDLCRPGHRYSKYHSLAVRPNALVALSSRSRTRDVYTCMMALAAGALLPEHADSQCGKQCHHHPGAKKDGETLTFGSLPGQCPAHRRQTAVYVLFLSLFPA